MEDTDNNVMLAKNIKDGKKVAIKKKYITNENVKVLCNEINLMKDSPHNDCVAEYYDSFIIEQDLFVVVEYMDGGCLTDVLNAQYNLNEEEIAYCCLQILRGLSYIHANNRIHGEIFIDHILFNSKGDIKLANFGYAVLYPEDASRRRNFVRPVPYDMAPEQIRGIEISAKADIWGLGIILWELVEKNVPYQDLHPLKALFLISTKGVPPPEITDKYSSELREFCSLCIEKDPKLRPDANELLNHGFLSKACTREEFASVIKIATEIARERKDVWL